MCSNYTKAFTIDTEEFDHCLPVVGKTRYKDDSGKLLFVFFGDGIGKMLPEDDSSAEYSD